MTLGEIVEKGEGISEPWDPSVVREIKLIIQYRIVNHYIAWCIVIPGPGKELKYNNGNSLRSNFIGLALRAT